MDAMLRAAFVSVAAWLSMGAGLAQQVWVVDKLNRPGADFTDLPAAVAAASAGDVLRVLYTSTLAADRYSAPTILGKGITIVGEGAAQPIVFGAWRISGVPSNQRLVLSNLYLLGSPLFGQGLGVRVMTSPGGVVLDRIQNAVDGTTAPSQFNSDGMKFTDCSEVVISRSSIQWYGGTWAERSTVMLADSTIRNAPESSIGGAGGPGIRLENARLSMARSSIYGGDQPPTWQDPNGAAGYAIAGRDGIVVIGGACTLSGGRNLNGNIGASIIYGISFMDVYVDFNDTVAIGGYFASTNVRYHSGPQTGLAFSQDATTLHVDQFIHTGGISALAIGGQATTPWSNSVVGPVYVDPSNFVSYWDLSVADMQMSRSFAIPPGLPRGTAVTMQAFELLPSGTYLTSNAVVAGAW